MELVEVKEFLEKLEQSQIHFDPHFYKRTHERPITEGMIRSYLNNISKLEKIELGRSSERFKLWYKISTKYNLVIIIEIGISKDLKVISAWNTYRKWKIRLKK